MPKTKVKRLILKQFQVATDRLMHIPGLTIPAIHSPRFGANGCAKRVSCLCQGIFLQCLGIPMVRLTHLSLYVDKSNPNPKKNFKNIIETPDIEGHGL
ncbi:hypothetical protein DN752_04840 [Echinicola strongylocentroti]|uniref:Uncharacterized protein n=1 Tax=Echinicola strongylocentroti TaxID=1795355 RepID=A0A2Z4IFP1_9BACT|nr:hypothetical protein DN752_04840 [Echinicola strongylocentroti]